MFSTYYRHKYNYLMVIKGIREWLMLWIHKSALVWKLLWLHCLQLTAYTGQFTVISILHKTDTPFFQHWIMSWYIKLKLHTTHWSPLEQSIYSRPKDAPLFLNLKFHIFLCCIFLIKMLNTSCGVFCGLEIRFCSAKLRNKKMDKEHSVLAGW